MTPNKIINHIFDNNLSREDAIRYLTIQLDVIEVTKQIKKTN